jgi:hypothetical protein
VILTWSKDGSLRQSLRILMGVQSEGRLLVQMEVSDEDSLQGVG